MLQALLADRFKLVLHRDNTEHAVYALVVAKGGPKLKDAVPDADPAAAPAEPPKGAITIGSGESQMQISGSPQGGQGMVISSAQTGKMHITMSPEGTMQLAVEKMNMAAFADALSQFVDRPVIDMTGLKGNYQVALNLTMADLMTVARASGFSMPGMASIPAMTGAARPADAASDPSASSSIFTAVQQLGLKLDPQKQPIERLVIDHLEKMPTEN
jgi:uncharacterized protein (TIGR03435 family)